MSHGALTHKHSSRGLKISGASDLLPALKPWSQMTKDEQTKTMIWGALSTLSAGASAYHGYKRTHSYAWAALWAVMGGMFPVVTPAVALAQGFGKKAR